MLLYLIKKRNVDIFDIDLLQITDQYLRYIDLMEELQIELAAEYLVMAATLAEYKSRMLLPKTDDEDEEEGDPRLELIERLREYQLFKAAAGELDALPRMERELHGVCAEAPPVPRPTPQPELALDELLLAMAQVQRRVEARTPHFISGEVISTSERIDQLRQRLSAVPGGEYTAFETLCDDAVSRAGVVVTVLALLTMTQQGEVETRQVEVYSAIHVRVIPRNS